MADPRFHTNHGPFPLACLAEIGGASLDRDADPDLLVRDVAPLDSAGPAELSFLDHRRYRDALRRSRAGACLLAPADAALAPPGMALLLTARPYLAFARIAQAFYAAPQPAQFPDGPAAIDPSAAIAPDVRLGPGVVIGAGARIGPGCRIGPHAAIGRHVEIGADCVIGAHVTITHSLIGARVTCHPGVRIGQDGFGFAPDASGHVKMPQLGRVLIGDDVEIGANTTIDRGAGPDTVIGAGTWIDNLVQIGHNVRVGRGCIITAQVGIAGSTQLEDFVALGGQAGLAGHLRIGQGARIAAQSGVIGDIAAGDTVMGCPAVPIRQFFRGQATLLRLARKKEAADE